MPRSEEHASRSSPPWRIGPGRESILTASIGREAKGNAAAVGTGVEQANLARQATDESIVLLKNDNHTLPLDRAKLKTIASIGPWTNEVLLDWYSGTPPIQRKHRAGHRGSGSRA